MICQGGSRLKSWWKLATEQKLESVYEWCFGNPSFSFSLMTVWQPFFFMVSSSFCQMRPESCLSGWSPCWSWDGKCLCSVSRLVGDRKNTFHFSSVSIFVPWFPPKLPFTPPPLSAEQLSQTEERVHYLIKNIPFRWNFHLEPDLYIPELKTDSL